MKTNCAVKGNCDTRKWPVKFRDFRETGPLVSTDPFILMFLVTCPLNESKAEVDLVITQTSLLLLC